MQDKCLTNCISSLFLLSPLTYCLSRLLKEIEVVNHLIDYNLYTLVGQRILCHTLWIRNQCLENNCTHLYSKSRYLYHLGPQKKVMVSKDCV